MHGTKAHRRSYVEAQVFPVVLFVFLVVVLLVSLVCARSCWLLSPQYTVTRVYLTNTREAEPHKSARRPQEEIKGYKAEAGKARLNIVQSTFQVLLHFLNGLLGIVSSIEQRWITGYAC